ncbi:FUSC family protein [Kitasatospora sp. NPDC088134]|uniref:FUSC family protein n=1 Tax=Kitasatospora sp. NPDC088134 TaxID=3364071 RepID=UPI0038236260
MRGSRPSSVAGVTRVLSPRGALALNGADGALPFALRAATALALPAVPLVLAGHPRLAVYAMLGSFATTFGRGLPYRRRARVLAPVALAMTAVVAAGSLLAGWAAGAGTAGAAAVVAATALVAGAAKFGCDAARLSGLGVVLLVFSFAVAANGAPTGREIAAQSAAAAGAAAVAWALSLVGRLRYPDRPQHRAAATALRAVAALLDTDPADPAARARARHRATETVLRAYDTLGARPPAVAAGASETGRGGDGLRATDLCWSLLVRSARRNPPDAAARADQLRELAAELTASRREPGARSGPSSGPSSGGAGAPVPGGAGRRAAELLGGGPGGRRAYRGAVLVVPALRMVLGTGAAGGLALLLGLGHGYWAALSAAAVLHSVSVRTTAHRAVQRTLGTFAGLLLAVAVLATGPGPAALVVVVVVLEFLLEYAVVRNYALGVLFVTPLALLMSDLAAPAPAGHLVLDRALGSVLGIVLGLLCALLVVHDRAAVRVERALAACAAATAAAERALAGGAPAGPDLRAELAAAAVELREADDAAAGELWEAGVDPAVLAAAEERAYLLLERLHRA